MTTTCTYCGNNSVHHISDEKCDICAGFQLGAFGYGDENVGWSDPEWLEFEATDGLHYVEQMLLDVGCSQAEYVEDDLMDDEIPF
jgi:hypothetical protein